MVQGRPLEEVIDLFWDGDLGPTILRLAREVYRLDTVRSTPHLRATFSRGARTAEEPMVHDFIFHLAPSHDAAGKVYGVIVYAQEETEPDPEMR